MLEREFLSSVDSNRLKNRCNDPWIISEKSHLTSTFFSFFFKFNDEDFENILSWPDRWKMLLWMTSNLASKFSIITHSCWTWGSVYLWFITKISFMDGTEVYFGIAERSKNVQLPNFNSKMTKFVYSKPKIFVMIIILYGTTFGWTSFFKLTLAEGSSELLPSQFVRRPSVC